ncbi:unnamed protein product [Prorocentrum cordatum]|uniref:Cellulase n=1 Tax=Prorocentrum cordatum TaxID=2364126 RepID=A0ABN9R354_9DINO|nr:unnamed protein product [Polarella glacialis]
MGCLLLVHLASNPSAEVGGAAGGQEEADAGGGLGGAGRGGGAGPGRGASVAWPAKGGGKHGVVMGADVGVWEGLGRAGHASDAGPGPNASASRSAGGVVPGSGDDGGPRGAPCASAADCSAGQACRDGHSGKVVGALEHCPVHSSCFCRAALQADRQQHRQPIVRIATVTSTTISATTTEAMYIDGPRVAGGAWYGLCYSTAGSRASAEAACSADANCTVLHDKGCTNTGVRYCFSVINDIVANFESLDSDACTYIRYQITTSTVSTSTIGSSTWASETSTATTTTAMYIDGPRVAGGAWSGLCYSITGSRASAEAACNADSNCIALHDKGCTNTGVRYCYSTVSEIVANFEGLDSDACTYIKYQVTTSTVSTATTLTGTTATTVVGAVSMTATSITTTSTTISTEALYIDGPRVASGAWSGLCYSITGSRASAEAACNADSNCIALHDKGCTNTGVRYCYSTVSEIVANFEGLDSDACTYIKYQVTTSTVSTATTLTGTTATTVVGAVSMTATSITTTSTTISTEALYIDGPRVAGSAWSGLCYSVAGSRASAEVACNADSNCVALHDKDCTNTGVRYCYSAVSEIVANFEGLDSDACTYVKYQVTTSTVSTTTTTAGSTSATTTTAGAGPATATTDFATATTGSVTATTGSVTAGSTTATSNSESSTTAATTIGITATTITSTGALYIDGPRVAGAAWSGPCYSTTGSRASAEAACNADLNCVALHDKNNCHNDCRGRVYDCYKYHHDQYDYIH